MKKYLSAVAIFLSILMVFASASMVSVIADVDYGDVTRDTFVDQKDVLAIRKHLSKEDTLTKTEQANADVYKDGEVNFKDLLILRNYLAEVEIKTLPFVPGGQAGSTVSTSSTTQKPEGTTDPNLPSGVDPYYINKLASRSTIYYNDQPCGYHTVAVNQVGYAPDDKKVIRLMEGKTNNPATVNKDSIISNATVYVVDVNTNTAVASFKSGIRGQFDRAILGTEFVFVSKVDISSFKTPGKYRIYSPIGYSYEFEIKENPYNRVTDDLLMAMYYQRCNGAIEESVLQKYDDYLASKYGIEAGSYFAKYSGYAREACHVESTGTNKGAEVVVCDTYDEATNSFVGNTDSQGNLKTYAAAEFSHGLHDAGDYGRYTQPAVQVVSDLLTTYMLYPEAYTLDVVQDTNGKGEKDNLPDILDHARWEAKFILNMQNEEGGFYHKICTAVFASAQWTLPESDYGFNGKRNDSYKGLRANNANFATTGSAVGALATCAKVFEKIDPEFAAECLVAAEKGYDWFINNRPDNCGNSPRDMTLAEAKARDVAPDTLYKNNSYKWQVGGGAYGGGTNEAKSEIWYMQTTLYRATGKDIYKNAIEANPQPTTSISAHVHSGHGTIAYILTALNNEYETDATIVTKCKNVFLNAGKSVNSTANALTNRFNTAITSYDWGSNARFCNALTANAVANKIKDSSDTTNYEQTIRDNIGYMLGVNVEGWSFITGVSEGSSKNVHHFPSNILKREKKIPCVPGLLAGGYTNESSAYISSDANLFRYRDEEGDFVCNEICVYWNSAAILAFSASIAKDIA